MLDPKTRRFYERTLLELRERGFPFLVGGAYALRELTGIVRHTKDLDLFVRRADIVPMLDALERAGFATELTYSHWLGKVYDGAEFVDVIFSSGNGLASVDDEYFLHATHGSLFGVPVQWCPVEEMIWSKAFVMERERYDGADVAHLIHACASRIDWNRLVSRFGEHWRVLLSHLVLFGFIYPHDQARIPSAVIAELTARLMREETQAETAASPEKPVCGGTLLSREQFLPDVRERGYLDARLTEGAMNENEIQRWTAAIASRR